MNKNIHIKPKSISVKNAKLAVTKIANAEEIIA